MNSVIYVCFRRGRLRFLALATLPARRDETAGLRVAFRRLAVLVTGADEVPLWLGRTRRNASQDQFLALAVRDRGCVLCQAGIDRCVAHHLMPWSAAGRGLTDVNQMTLLCQRCHRGLHHRNHTLYQAGSPSGRKVWATRPATPRETPAAPPRYRQRE